MLSTTDPLKETTSYTYSPGGFCYPPLQPFTGAVTKFTYDPSNRLSSATDSQGYQLLLAMTRATAPRVSGTRTQPRPNWSTSCWIWHR